MATDTVLVTREDGVTTLTLNRPDRLNAFNVEMHDALAAAFWEIEHDASCRVVVLTGAGRGFCTGQDLAARVRKPGEPPRDLGQSLDDRYNPLVRRMRNLPRPIIVAVNGVAAGAGANIALNGDIVIAARSARFIQTFAKVGLMPDAGGTWLLPRLLGEARAKALAMLAEPLDATTAAQWGLIWKVVDDAELATVARTIAARLAGQSMTALAQIKQAIQAAATTTLDRHLDIERDGQRQLGLGDDYAEGVNAFLEKRPARFTDKV